MGGYYYDGMGAAVVGPPASSAVVLTYAQTVAADSPNVWWKCDEASGTLTDSINSLVLNKNGAGQIYRVAGPGTGNFGITLVAASSGSYSKTDGAASPLDTGDVFTLEIWVKRASISADMPLMDKGGTAYAIYFKSADNKLQLDQRATASIVTSTTALTDTASWHHIVVTKSAATVKQYIDAVDVTGAVSNHTILDQNSDFSLGGGGIGFFDGTISHAAIYPTALSAGRVSAHYAAMV